MHRLLQPVRTAALWALLAMAPVVLAQGTAPATGAVKWHPGHYVTLVGKAGDDSRYMSEVLEELARYPVLRGVQIRYTWAQLEPEPGVYRFEAIERDLAALAARDKRLFILLQTKAFDARTPTVPAWLRGAEFEGGAFKTGGGQAAAGRERASENIRLWNAGVRDRLSALVKALGAKFDAHPHLEGISMTETAMGQAADGPIDAAREEQYFRNLLAVVKEMRTAFPRTVTFQFVNYPRRILPWFVDGLRGMGAGLGGPDVLPEDPGLVKGIYPYYARLAGQVPLAPSIQHENYVARRARGPVDPPTIDELYTFSRDQLKANYLFWTRRLYANDKPYLKVLDFISQPGFPRDAAGGLATACPKAYQSCVP